jgi:hypothetical protein
MKNTIEKTLLLGMIIELCVGEGDIDLLDLIYKLLAANMGDSKEEI